MSRFIALFLFTLLLFSGVSAKAVTLTWTDNSDNEEGFIIERGQVVVEDQVFKAGSFVEIDRVAQDVTTYADANAEPDRIYCYRVVAFANVVNAEPQEVRSSFSNVACAFLLEIKLGFQ